MRAIDHKQFRSAFYFESIIYDQDKIYDHVKSSVNFKWRRKHFWIRKICSL